MTLDLKELECDMNTDLPNIGAKKRSGGRSARQALRSAPLAKELRPVNPGLIGGTYNPLTQEEILRIHNSVLQVLEEIGLADAPESGVKAMTSVGAVLGEDGRLRFPRSLVEDTLSFAARDFVLHSRTNSNDLLLKKNRVHYGTAGAAVHVVDLETNEYRDSTVKDLFSAAKLSDHLDNIHFLQRPMVCRDIPDNFEMDLNTVFACCAGTSKHVGVSFTEAFYVKPIMEMVHILAGDENSWLEKPFISNSNCFVVPPLKFATESCLVMEELSLIHI